MCVISRRVLLFVLLQQLRGKVFALLNSPYSLVSQMAVFGAWRADGWPFGGDLCDLESIIERFDESPAALLFSVGRYWTVCGFEETLQTTVHPLLSRFFFVAVTVFCRLVVDQIDCRSKSILSRRSRARRPSFYRLQRIVTILRRNFR